MSASDQRDMYYEAGPRGAAPYPQEPAAWDGGAAPDAAFFAPDGWGGPAPDGWADPFAGQQPYYPQEDPAQRPVRAQRKKDPGDLAYTFWSVAIAAGILLTVFAFIYGCVA